MSEMQNLAVPSHRQKQDKLRTRHLLCGALLTFSVFAGACSWTETSPASDAPRSEVWQFDQLDTLGGHPVTVLGDPQVIDASVGKAVAFDGEDDALFLDIHPLAGAETFTWEVIFRPDGDGAREQRFFHLQARDPETGADIQTRLLFETRLTDGHWYLDSYANAGEKAALMDPQKLHPTDAWYHVAMVYDGEAFRNYVNGVLQSAAQVHLTPQGSGHSPVGARINKVHYFKGAIHVSRMTHTALRPDQFLKLPQPR